MLIRLLLRSSLIWVCPVCLGLYGKQLVFEILEHLPKAQKNLEVKTKDIYLNFQKVITSSLKRTTILWIKSFMKWLFQPGLILGIANLYSMESHDLNMDFGFDLGRICNARITITYVCYNALIFAESIRRGLSIYSKVHGWKFKISEILNFRNTNFKTCRMRTKMNSFKFKG